MDRPARTIVNPLFPKNLLVLGCLVAGKAIIAFALFFFTPSIMHIEVISSCALLAALCALCKLGIFSIGSAEATDDASEPPSASEVFAGARIIAIPLLGFLLCQCTQGIGWSALLYERSSMLLQTQDSFAFVQCGSLLCAGCLFFVRKRITNIMSFRYSSILACLLLLVIPWTFADLSGGARVLTTALPWGFASSFLLVITLVDLASVRKSVFLLVSAAIVVLDVAAIVVSGFGLLLLGDVAVNIIWRVLLTILIALSAIEILSEYQNLEKSLGRARVATTRAVLTNTS